MISNTSTADEQLHELKVKHLRSYLLAKNISHDTCTEKRDLVDLIKQNRQLPFTNLLNQQTATAGAATTTQTKNNGPFTNFQSTVSSFANQMNNFASNIQDYVSNTVSDAMNTTLGDDLPPPTTNNSNNHNRGPFNHAFPSSGNSNPTTNNASTNQQPRRPPPAQSTTASPSTSV